MSRVKPSRIRAMREIESLLRETKEIFEEFKEQTRAKTRLSRKARKFANKVRKVYADMKMPEDPMGPGLHDEVEALAKALHTHYSYSEADELPKIRFEVLFEYLRRLGDVPWLNAYKEEEEEDASKE